MVLHTDEEQQREDADGPVRTGFQVAVHRQRALVHEVHGHRADVDRTQTQTDRDHDDVG